MKIRNTFVSVLAMAMFGTTVLAPVAAFGQRYDSEAQHRQNKQNEWRNLTIGSVAVAAIGVATHNKTLMAVGAAGALYSGYRLSQDGNGDRHRRNDHDRNDRYRNDRDRNGRDRNDHRYDERDSQWNRGDRDDVWESERNRNVNVHEWRDSDDCGRNRDWSRNKDENHDRGNHRDKRDR